MSFPLVSLCVWEPYGFGHELVDGASGARALGLLKTHRIEKLMRVKGGRGSRVDKCNKDTSGEALKTTRPELTHLRILWDLEQEEDHQQGG
ncbi:hypothetical protein TNCV_1458121 [Trichonephila clavipes]|nr:hypothetical protein TNCV_1458121 [Trichonephila clavipes]